MGRVRKMVHQSDVISSIRQCPVLVKPIPRRAAALQCPLFWSPNPELTAELHAQDMGRLMETLRTFPRRSPEPAGGKW